MIDVINLQKSFGDQRDSEEESMLRSIKAISLRCSDHPAPVKVHFAMPELYGRPDRRKHCF